MKARALTQYVLAAVLLVAGLASLSGCVYMVVGGIGAVGGYIVSPDTVEGISDNDTQSVWGAALDVASIMGVITEKSEAGGMFLAAIHGARVTVSIVPVNQETTKLTVKARKAYLPRISLAQDIFVKIMSRLNE